MGFFSVNSPPILEPILVVGLNRMLTGFGLTDLGVGRFTAIWVLEMDELLASSLWVPKDEPFKAHCRCFFQ